MKKKYILLLIMGIFLIIAAIGIAIIALSLITQSVKPNLSIIGGADEPTLLLLWSEFRIPTIGIIIEFIAGIACITAALRIRRKNDKRNKK